MTATLKPKNDTERPVFPFTAIIGQEEMKLALILNVIDPRIGGVMIMGDRGTGKSTTIRAVADLLPAIQVVADDPFNSSTTDFELMSESVKNAVEKNEELPVGYKKVPMVDLPLGATEDRVCGTIDIEKALTEGVKAFDWKEDAYYGRVKGLLTHTNTRKDKTDLFPQQEIIDMILSL